jgi:hypothetical protein
MSFRDNEITKNIQRKEKPNLYETHLFRLKEMEKDAHGDFKSRKDLKRPLFPMKEENLREKEEVTTSMNLQNQSIFTYI